MEDRDYTVLYSREDKKTMKTAEDSLDPKVDRVAEIVNYCHEAGIKKIGIANCISFNKQAKSLQQTLSAAGFEVDQAHCKLGHVRFKDLVPDYKGVMCNPVGQADYLAEKNTEINIMMGLCLGHDMIFNAKSKAPVTPIVVKDRKLNHRTLDILKGNSNK